LKQDLEVTNASNRKKEHRESEEPGTTSNPAATKRKQGHSIQRGE